jgi:hypothetical protein
MKGGFRKIKYQSNNTKTRSSKDDRKDSRDYARSEPREYVSRADGLRLEAAIRCSLKLPFDPKDVGSCFPIPGGVNVADLPSAFVASMLRSANVLQETGFSHQPDEMVERLRRFICFKSVLPSSLVEAGFNKAPVYPILFSRTVNLFTSQGLFIPDLNPEDINGNPFECYPPPACRIVHDIDIFSFETCFMNSLTTIAFAESALPSRYRGKKWDSSLWIQGESDALKISFPRYLADVSMSAGVVFGPQSICSTFCRNDSYNIFFIGHTGGECPLSVIPDRTPVYVPPDLEATIEGSDLFSRFHLIPGTEFGFYDPQRLEFVPFRMRKSPHAERFIRPSILQRGIPSMLDVVTKEVLTRKFFWCDFNSGDSHVYAVSGATVDASLRYLVYEPGRGLTSVGFSQTVFNALCVLCTTDLRVRHRVVFELLGRITLPYLANANCGDASSFGLPWKTETHEYHASLPMIMMSHIFANRSTDGGKKMNLPRVQFSELGATLCYPHSDRQYPPKITEDYDMFNTSNMFWDTVLTVEVMLRICTRGRVPLEPHRTILTQFLQLLIQLRSDVIQATDEGSRVRDMFSGVESRRKAYISKPCHGARAVHGSMAKKMLYFVPGSRYKPCPFSNKRIPSFTFKDGSHSQTYNSSAYMQVRVGPSGFKQWSTDPAVEYDNKEVGYSITIDDLHRVQLAFLGPKYLAGASQQINSEEEWIIERDGFFNEKGVQSPPAPPCVTIPSPILIEGSDAIHFAYDVPPTGAFLQDGKSIIDSGSFFYKDER